MRSTSLETARSSARTVTRHGLGGGVAARWLDKIGISTASVTISPFPRSRRSTHAETSAMPRRQQ